MIDFDDNMGYTFVAIAGREKYIFFEGGLFEKIFVVYDTCYVYV